MTNKVYFISSENYDDAELGEKLIHLIKNEKLFDFIKSKELIAIKTHFGEGPKVGVVGPEFLKLMGDLIKKMGASPYLTETSTLYRGNRNNAVKHLMHAYSQGYTHQATGMPIIMSDGLTGDEEHEVPIKGKIYNSVKVASMFAKCAGLITVTHFTGHMSTGFGAALKNIGMGCSSRRGKREQHSKAKPSITRLCKKCGACIKWCPQDAITMEEESAVINQDLCIGCGECLTMCRYDAVKYDWEATYEDLQKKIIEHAMGIVELHKYTSLYINFLTKISKDCDCVRSFEQVLPDIGILVSTDPVAIDAASLDLVEKKAGKKLSEIAYDIPYNYQIDYAKEIGFSSGEYKLIEFK